MLYYISDIHTEHKIDFDALPEVMPDEEFGKVIANIVDDVFSSTLPHGKDDYLLIAGDTCESVQVGYFFYKRLTELWKPDHIIVTLGNHELWTADQQWTDEGKKVKSNLKDIIAAWRKVFADLGIVFLQNETYDLPDENAIVLGGLGFSGQNDYVNACTGMYLRVLTTRRQDQMQSRVFDRLYNETVQHCEEEPVSVPTAFFSGHTHQNRCSRYDGVAGKKWFYEDGQIGYPIRSRYAIKMTYI